jgi:flagellar basal body-associated protein FliL
VLLYPYIEKKLATGEEKNQPITEDISAAGFDFLVDEENRNILHIKPPFTINLAGLDGRWVMQVTIWFEVVDGDVARELNDNPAKFYRMTDDIVRTLKSWTYAEINFGNGMDRLKMQLRDHMNGYIEGGKVVKVIFNDVIFTEILPRARPVS